MNSRTLRLGSADGAASTLGPLESRVIEIMWSHGDWMAVSDVMTEIGKSGGGKTLAYSTVKTIMQNLVNKRHLNKKAAGRANVFIPAISREAFQASMIGDVLRPLYRSQRNPLLAHIAGELANDDESYEEFVKLLAAKRAETRRG